MIHPYRKPRQIRELRKLRNNAILGIAIRESRLIYWRGLLFNGDISTARFRLIKADAQSSIAFYGREVNRVTREILAIQGAGK